MTKTSNENQTYEEFAAKRKWLKLKYDEKVTLETNLKEFSKRTHVLHSPEATEFLHQTAHHALRLERMIYSFMGGEHQASIDVVLGGSGVIAIDGKHDDILGKNGSKFPYGPHAKHPPMQLVLAGEMLRNELGLSSGLSSGLGSGLLNKPLYRLDKNNTCRHCMHNNLGMCNLGPIKGDKPIPVVVLKIANRNFYKERCNSYRTWNE